HEFAEKEMRPVADQYDEAEETPWDVMRKAHELGLDAMGGFPEEYGGGGIDLLTTLVLQEELSWGDAGIAVAINASGLGPAGIAGFVIEKGNPGMRQGRKERKLGVRASHTAQVIFEDCFVAEDARLGYDKEGNATGPGAIGAMLMLEATRPLIAAGAVGI